MKKNFVLDTNVVLHDPDALAAFDDNTVNIPITVIEEIDRFKKNSDEIGRNARYFSRVLDDLRQQGDLRKGIANHRGGSVRVLLGMNDTHQLPPALTPDRGDNLILALCLTLQRREQDRRLVFVTKDMNLRIKANALGIPAEDYRRGKVRLEELFSGTSELEVPGDTVDAFYDQGGVELDQELSDNHFLCLTSEQNPNHSALGRYRARQRRVEPLRLPKTVWGIYPRNREQRYSVDALLDDDLKLVTLVGKAGTGKTLLAIAAGLQKSVEDRVYQRLLVSRPVFPLGRDIGFLPGDVQEKLRPWMQPIFDNIELLFAGFERRESKDGRELRENRESRGARGAQELIDMDRMAIEPLTYIRGRSIPYQYIIVDEAQNLTPHEIKTIITRAGEGTKIVLTGDPYQIDHPYIDATSNGLSYCVERFKQSEIAAHVTLVKGERSPLAELAANLL
jgi:PhoH-like ATPase